MLPNWHSSSLLAQRHSSSFPTPLALSSQAEGNSQFKSVKGYRTSPNYKLDRCAGLGCNYSPEVATGGALLRKFNDPVIKFALVTTCACTRTSLRHVASLGTCDSTPAPLPARGSWYVVVLDCRCLLQALVDPGQTKNSQKWYTVAYA